MWFNNRWDPLLSFSLQRSWYSVHFCISEHQSAYSAQLVKRDEVSWPLFVVRPCKSLFVFCPPSPPHITFNDAVFSQHVGVNGCLSSLRKEHSQMSVLFICPCQPISFPFLLKHSPPCIKTFLTWGCIGLITSLSFCLSDSSFSWFLGKVFELTTIRFHLVKNLRKHRAQTNLIFTSLCIPFLICFLLIFQSQTKCIAKKTICVFSISHFLATTNHRAYSLLEIVFFFGSRPTSSFILY